MTAGCQYPRWPDGADPAAIDEFEFCGLPCWPGESYCARHLARCRRAAAAEPEDAEAAEAA